MTIRTWYDIRPTEFAPYGHPQWKADRSTPLTWGYRVHQCPGKFALKRGDEFTTREEAEAAAEQAVREVEAVAS